MIRDPEVSDNASLGTVALRPNGAPDATTDISVNGASALRWRGRQTIFPLAYRGWAVAGYTAEGAKATEADRPGRVHRRRGPVRRLERPDRVRRHRHRQPRVERGAGLRVPPAHELKTLPGATEHAGRPAVARPARQPRRHADARCARRASAPTRLTIGTGSSEQRRGQRGHPRRPRIPTASLAIGIGPFGGSLGIGPSFGLVDYEDMNGDGYPDVITPGNIHYTNQRGSFLPAARPASTISPSRTRTSRSPRRAG